MKLNKLIFLLLLFSSIASASLTIAGIHCLDVVIVNKEWVVCIRAFEDQKRDILTITNNSSFIENLYYVFLLRVPDVPGETYWLNQLNTNSRTKEQILDIFVNSEEYKNLHK